MSDSDHQSLTSKRVRNRETTQGRRTPASRVKRRRTSGAEYETRNSIGMGMGDSYIDDMAQVKRLSQGVNEEAKTPAIEPWSLSTPVAGRYTAIDPVLTSDEKYFFVGLAASVNVYSAATSRLVHTLHLGARDVVIGYRLHPTKEEHLYVFTSDGWVSQWDWLAANKLWHRKIGGKMTFADLCSADLENDIPLRLLSLRDQNNGRKEMAITYLNDKTLSETVILQTDAPLEYVKSSAHGRVLVACGGSHLLIGVLDTPSGGSESIRYVWKQQKLPECVTSLDIRCSSETESRRKVRSARAIDIVLGESGGSILVYRDILKIFEDSAEVERIWTPRRLHWHRDPVSAVRWSRDGNYIISGGSETVLVLWQLDTGRKQYLPHLSSQICNIVVSATGGAYLLKLADNSVIILSARELQPSAAVTGFQLYPRANQLRSNKAGAQRPLVSAAVLHPQHSDRILIPVPAYQQVSPQGLVSADYCVLQTYDIRTDSHISRQALTRTNATTLRVSADGTRINAPDVTQMDISLDGKWMATVDNWNTCSQDFGTHATCNTSVYQSTGFRSETFLKFWRWSSVPESWELVSRIDAPHFFDGESAPVRGLASRPHSHEFATIGSDGVLRFWCPGIRSRSGLNTEHDTEPLEVWRCRNLIDLNGYLNHGNSSHVNAACLSYSQDGSVLALCLESPSFTNSGLTILVDVQNCVVRCSRLGVYPAACCAIQFLGCHLIIASSESLSIWDTVRDLVRTVNLPGTKIHHSVPRSPLLAVNPKTQTFAVATSYKKSTSEKKHRAPGFQVVVYDIASLTQVSRQALRQCPLALLSSPHSRDYVLVDSAASIQKLAYDRNIPLSFKPQDLTSPVNTGLADFFGNQQLPGLASHPSSEDNPTVNTDIPAPGRLANVFRDAPFILPPAGILFRDVVEALSA